MNINVSDKAMAELLKTQIKSFRIDVLSNG